MKNWFTYIDKQKKEYLQTAYPDESNAKMVVVIPCYNEPNLQETLQSIRACIRPPVNVLVAIVINASERSDDAVVIQNRATYNEVKIVADRYNEPSLLFFPLLFERLPRKHAGVGLARKIGMDLAVDHFSKHGMREGIIVSLDADCLVSENYLVDIFNAFHRDRHLSTTIHDFSHRVEGDDPLVWASIQQYEAYLRYFRDMLQYTGFPYYYHTIGSAFAVKADAYVKVGGMGRQQGGEDFYFLHKLFESGKTKMLEDVVVYPMARYSDRVPFGTGPALQKMVQQSSGTLGVYSRKAFMELKRLFDMKDFFYKRDDSEVIFLLNDLHPALLRYLREIDFKEMVNDCNGNCARLETFQKRFFHHFNAFRVIKYLNFVHPDPFSLEDIRGVS